MPGDAAMSTPLCAVCPALVDTPLVDLDEEGDAHFSGKVAIPVVCATEQDIAFLIRTASGRWIGNGTVLR